MLFSNYNFHYNIMEHFSIYPVPGITLDSQMSHLILIVASELRDSVTPVSQMRKWGTEGQ